MWLIPGYYSQPFKSLLRRQWRWSLLSFCPKGVTTLYRLTNIANCIITSRSIPAWASGPSEILRYFTCSGSPVQHRGFEILRNIRKGRL